MKVALNPDQVEGLLVVCDGALCAVLTRLDEDLDPPGGWFLETAFGPLDNRTHPCFSELQDVEAWVHATWADFLSPPRGSGPRAQL